MSKYLFEGDFQNMVGAINVQLLLIHFQDENEVHFIYSPHLDLTGYGSSLKAAKDSFGIVIDDFLDYTLKKNTLTGILKNLGWEVKGSLKKPKKVLAPKMAELIKDNDYVSDIFDRYPVSTFHQGVGIPAFS